MRLCDEKTPPLMVGGIPHPVDDTGGLHPHRAIPEEAPRERAVVSPALRQWIRDRVSTYLSRVVRDGELGRLPGFLEPVEPRPGPALPHDPHLERLARRCGLDRDERAVLFLAASPSMSVDVYAVFRAIQPDPLAAGVALGLLCDLATDSADAADALLTRLRFHSTLVSRGLLQIRGDAHWPGRSADVPAEVVSALCGRAVEPSPALAVAVREPPTPEPWPPTAQRAIVEAAETRGLAVRGPSGVGRASALASAFGELLVVDMSVLTTGPDWRALLDEAARIATLRGARLVVDLTRPVSDDVATSVLRRLVNGSAAVLLAPDAALPGWARRRFTVIDAPPLDRTAMVECWRAALAGADCPGDIAHLAGTLARRFPLGNAAIREVVARADVGRNGPTRLHAEVRRFVPHALEAYAERYAIQLTWDDVVLADETRRGLQEILVHARQHDTVFEQWGLDRLVPYGRGLGCLFAGPPGTGKTMMAGIIANTLQRELYRVDISRVVSKWLGETEKSLARLFDEAERAGAILFFDEADSLFAARTDVRGSNDRYANMEVNFLLQRMERFDGMSILATNLEKGLDAAFKRRLRFTVHFPEPGAPEREQLWQTMLRRGLPVGEVDARLLGRRFRFTGASIKNTVLRAAFYAAERGGVIDTAMLVEAGEAEMLDRGRL